MERDKLCSKIRDYKNGNRIALNEIISQIKPMVKKFALKCFFMEYDDAFQEFSMVLIEAVSKIRTYENDGQCIVYINTCFKNKYCLLCKNYYIYKEIEELYENKDIPSQIECFSDIIFIIDISRYINQIECDSHKKIAELYLVEGKSDREISETLCISRQYVNRVRRRLLNDLRTEYFMQK